VFFGAGRAVVSFSDSARPCRYNGMDSSPPPIVPFHGCGACRYLHGRHASWCPLFGIPKPEKPIVGDVELLEGHALRRLVDSAQRRLQPSKPKVKKGRLPRIIL
jgi:hypothetical protein